MTEFYYISLRLRLLVDFGPQCPETEVCLLSPVEFDENGSIAGSSGILGFVNWSKKLFTCIYIYLDYVNYIFY